MHGAVPLRSAGSSWPPELPPVLGGVRCAWRRADDDSPPRPLYVSTATQIGLLGQPGIPDLPSALLPAAAPAACAALLRRWLLVPPRPSVADHAQAACAALETLDLLLRAVVRADIRKVEVARSWTTRLRVALLH